MVGSYHRWEATISHIFLLLFRLLILLLMIINRSVKFHKKEAGCNWYHHNINILPLSKKTNEILCTCTREPQHTIPLIQLLNNMEEIIYGGKRIV
jgi:hypothetical protein